jgi:hypothetical protein
MVMRAKVDNIDFGGYTSIQSRLNLRVSLCIPAILCRQRDLTPDGPYGYITAFLLLIREYKVKKIFMQSGTYVTYYVIL